MRLLLLTNVFPNPFQPTKGVFNLELARALARGAEVRVISPISWVDEWRAKTRDSKWSHERLQVIGGVEVHYPRYYYPPKILRRFYAWFLWRSVRRTVSKLLRSYVPDAVLGYWAHPDGEVAVRLARLIGVPAIVMVGGTDVLMLTRQNGRRRCVQKVLQAADAVIAVSNHLKAKVVELQTSPDKVHVVTRGVCTDLFSPGERLEARRRLGISAEGRVLLWVGRMVFVKGLDVLLEACSELHARGVGFRLYLVGDGPMRTSLAAESKALGLSEVVSFVGPRLHSQLPDWYRAADLTVLPSRSEGIPNVLRESLACGTPFVASRVGGIPELTDERSGRLVPPGDSAALAQAISQLLSAQEPAVQFPSRHLGWSESAESLLRVLRPLVPPARDSETPWLKRRPEPSGMPALVAGRRRCRQWLRARLAAALPRRLLLTCGPSDSGSVSLTFDDGPHPDLTPRLLDRLKRHGIIATFFVVGQKATRYPDLVRRIAAEGHVVGHHSFYHVEPGLTSARQLIDEVRRTRDLLDQLLGEPPTLFRPPKGEVSAWKFCRLWRMGQTIVLWNVDSKDYFCQSPNEVLAHFQRRPLCGGDLVLMHDNLSHAAEVLPHLVEDARKRGLTFTTAARWAR